MELPDYLKYERAARDSFYMDLEERYSPYLTEVEWACVVQALGDIRGKRVLDAGCGSGRFLARLVERGALCVGVDLSRASLMIAAKRAYESDPLLLQAELSALPFKSETFDRVLCANVFHALLVRQDALKALKELGRVLKRGGSLVLTTFNYHLADRLRRKKFRRSFSEGINFWRYDVAELRHLLGEAYPSWLWEVRVGGIAHFHRWPLKRIGRWLYRVTPHALLALDRGMEHFPGISRYSGHLLLAVARKGG